MTPENCPACGRELVELEDFPRVEVRSAELLPLPEKILHWSSARAVHLAQFKDENLPDELKGARVVKPLSQEEIDLTEEIKEVVNSDPIQQYLDALAQKVGVDIETSKILPPFQRGGYFQGTFVIPNSNYFLSIQSKDGEEGVAILKLWGQGPNMGSAGGPTLRVYADLAKVEFKGKLLHQPAASF